MKRLSILLALCLYFVTADLRVAAADPQPADGGVIPVFSFDRSFTEAPLGEDFLFSAAGSESFHQLLERLKKARDDKQVRAIVCLGTNVALGAGQTEEVRQMMDEIRAAGKSIYVHAESLSMQSYVLYSAATEISMVPNGDVWLTGLRAESLHVRGLMDKIGVEPDFLTCGDYKSAAEMFTRKAPSPAADQNLTWLLDGLYEAHLESIARGRKTSAQTVRQWINKGLYSAAEAKKLGIIDAVEFRSDFVSDLKASYGNDVQFETKYARKKKIDIDFSSPLGLFKFYADLFAGGSRDRAQKDAVAIVYVEGPIMAGKPAPGGFPFGSQGIAYSTPIRKALDKAADDDSIKAVVLRVNSPGGSAVGSEVILQATRRVRDNKPLVISMGDVAGSGGYYVACAADTIFANRSTITASIGVVAGKLVTRDMWNKVGIHWKTYERGESAGILAADEPFSDQDRQTLQSWMDEIYEAFKGHVVASREDRLKRELEEIAGGRVYTGEQALELGLVDRLGGLNEAIAYVAKQANLSDYDIRVVPRPKHFAELLREALSGEQDDDQPLSLSLGQLRPGADGTIAALALPYLQGLEPARAISAQNVLLQLEILQREHASLLMPVVRFRSE